MSRQPHVRRAQDAPVDRESLAELLLGGAAIALWFVFLFVIVPILAGTP